MAEHDSSYKQLFSHHELVVDLLLGFVREKWIDNLDLDTLTPVNSSFISDDLRSRESDVIWRVRCNNQWVYIYILIEFQSSVDRFMAVRLMTYLGLLYQDLIKTDKLLSNGKLPPVLPIVLYNGQRPWSAAQSIELLIQAVPGGLRKYCPAFSYLLLDEARYQLDENIYARNLVAAVFRLEQCQDPKAVQLVTAELVAWLKTPQQDGLRWVLMRALPEAEQIDTRELTEVNDMLAENLENWAKRNKDAGWREGKQEGKREGKQQGMQQGMQKGKAYLLQRMLQLKFRTLDEATLQRINTADDDAIMRWSDRILTAQSLDEIFKQ